MSYVIGIDPGTDGALAVLSDTSLDLYRMPVIKTPVGRTVRLRVDPQGVWDLMACLNFADLVVIEGIGGRPQQSASAAFVLGFSAALPFMACAGLGLKVETVQPHVWKRFMKVPAKKDKTSTKLIMRRAEAMFPDEKANFYTPRGRALDGCAEAALMAAWGREFVIKEGRYVGRVQERMTTSQRVWGVA